MLSNTKYIIPKKQNDLFVAIMQTSYYLEQLCVFTSIELEQSDVPTKTKIALLKEIGETATRLNNFKKIYEQTKNRGNDPSIVNIKPKDRSTQEIRECYERLRKEQFQKVANELSTYSRTIYSNSYCEFEEKP